MEYYVLISKDSFKILTTEEKNIFSLSEPKFLIKNVKKNEKCETNCLYYLNGDSEIINGFIFKEFLDHCVSKNELKDLNIIYIDEICGLELNGVIKLLQLILYIVDKSISFDFDYFNLKLNIKNQNDINYKDGLLLMGKFFDFFSSASSNDNAKFKKNKKEVIDVTKHISSNVESYIIFYIFFMIHSINLTKKFVLLFNCIAGFGKTRFIEEIYQNFLFKNLQDKISISCATARAMQNYSKASTVHSTFKINPKKTIYHIDRNLCEKTSLIKPGGPDVFIIDEFSMIGHNTLESIFFFLKNVETNKFVCFVGDSAQLRPVKEKIYNKNESMFNIIEFRQNDKSIVHRFSSSDCLKCLIVEIKKVIETVNSNKNCKFEISEDYLNYWIEKFFMFNISDDNITNERICEDLVKVQLETFSKLKLDKLGDIQDIPIIVGYKNSYTSQIQKIIYKKCDIEKSMLSSMLSDNIDMNFLSNISNIIVKRSTFTKLENNRNFFYDYLKSMPGTVAFNDNIFYRGSYIMCRKNDHNNKIFNGMKCVFLNYETTNQFKSLTKVNIGNKYDNKSELFVMSVIEDNEFYKILESLYFILYDVINKKVLKLNFKEEYACEKCEKQNCVHGSDDSVVFLTFQWHTYYATTIYNLQGVTLCNSEIICNTDEVLFSDKLRIIYVLISRLKNPKQLIIDKLFILKSLQAIFNNKSTIKPFYKKLKKQNINYFDDIVLL